MTSKQAEWAERVRDWKRSGLSSRRFCEDKPYRPSTLQWWSTKLRAQRGASSTAASVPAKTAVRLVRVRPVAAAKAGSIYVEIGGARISVSEGFDAELLRAVVCALEGSR